MMQLRGPCVGSADHRVAHALWDRFSYMNWGKAGSRLWEKLWLDLESQGRVEGKDV